jgi:hypothetical protein
VAAAGTELRYATQSAPAGAGARSPPVGRAALAGYACAALAIAFGWIVTRERALVDPLDGVGYWLGVAGASLMATLLLYPLRKRLRWMRVLGPTKHWFRMHMIFGVAGPVLILYHCNFTRGSINDTVALACTLLVAVSGIVGRYLYMKLHVDLDGHRTTLRELSGRARITAAQSSEIRALVPDLLERITTYDELVLAPHRGSFATLALPFRLAIATRWRAFALRRFARATLRKQARKSPVIAAQRKRLEASTGRFIDDHLRRVRRVAELGSYERLFSLWHVFHLPFFYMLVVAALIHVLAVHMY